MEYQKLAEQVNGLIAHIANTQNMLVNMDLRNRALNLQIEMLREKLIEHDICTEEEMLNSFEEKVNIPMQQYVEELSKLQEEKFKEAQEAMQKKEESKIIIPGADETSSIIDASNRFQK